MINSNGLLHYKDVEELTMCLDSLSGRFFIDADLVSKIKRCEDEYVIIERHCNISIDNQKTLLKVWDLRPKSTIGRKKHTVALGRDPQGFFFHCGTLPDENKDSFCNYFTSPIRIEYKIKNPNTPTMTVCKHILAVVKNYFKENVVRIIISELESDWQHTYGDKSLQKKQEPIDELEYLKRFAFKANVLIEGDRGSGKTYDVYKLAREYDIEPVSLGGHAGIESIDLLGHLVPYNAAPAVMSKVSVNDLLSGASTHHNNATQQLVWKDGALTEAFRKAASGQKTILILDELLRTPQRELNILLTALSPINGRYFLRTGRILSVENGVANEETIKAPVENLYVVATTNVGGQYAVDEIDPALAERFIIVRKDTTITQLKTILNKYADEKGFTDTIILQLIEFFKKMSEAKKQGIIENAPTTRTLSRAIQLADKDSDVWDRVKDHILLWIGRDTEGFPIKEQEDAIIKVIASVKSMK